MALRVLQLCQLALEKPKIIITALGQSISNDACIHSDMTNQGCMQKIRSLNLAAGWDDS